MSKQPRFEWRAELYVKAIIFLSSANDVVNVSKDYCSIIYQSKEVL